MISKRVIFTAGEKEENWLYALRCNYVDRIYDSYDMSVLPQDKDLVLGQSQGAVAMGISNVLTENCPLGNDGPGNGQWNLGHYQISRLIDIPTQTLIAIPPPDNDQNNARAIGEAAMCPIAPHYLMQ